jgi:UDP-glucose 4-epimerase
VTIFDNVSSGKKGNIEHLLTKNNVSFIEGNILDLDILSESFKDTDGVFHHAALVSVPQSVQHPMDYHEVNVTGTLNVLLAARDNGLRKVVIASSAAVYGNSQALPKHEDMLPTPLSPYAVMKLMDEYYAKIFTDIYGIETVCLRYFNVYGPRQDPASAYAAVVPKFISLLMKGKAPIIYGDGEQTRDLVFVKDVIQANIRAMEKNAQGVFNIASGKETTVNRLARELMKIFEMPGDPLYEKTREGDVYKSFADISKARETFGFEPVYSLNTGMRETVDWFSTQAGPR